MTETVTTDSLLRKRNGTSTQLSRDIRRVTAKPTSKLDYPLDKINSNIWGRIDNLNEGDPMIFGMEKRGSHQEANVRCGITPSGLTLSIYDKRLYLAISALFNSGNEVISSAQIYAKMGNKGRPNQKIIEKITASLDKMERMNLLLNNKDEITVNKRYPVFDYNGPLLPFERQSVYINNMYCADAIHILGEPPLVSFAHARKQITTIPLELLESPVSKTEQNLCIEDYLIERIAHVKRQKTTSKLLLKTVFQRCGINDKKQKQRAPNKIKAYLNHYQNCGFIKGFTIDDESITIQC